MTRPATSQPFTRVCAVKETNCASTGWSCRCGSPCDSRSRRCIRLSAYHPFPLAPPPAAPLPPFVPAFVIAPFPCFLPPPVAAVAVGRRFARVARVARHQLPMRGSGLRLSHGRRRGSPPRTPSATSASRDLRIKSTGMAGGNSLTGPLGRRGAIFRSKRPGPILNPAAKATKAPSAYPAQVVGQVRRFNWD